jgi:hypothetical protein
MVGTSTEEGTGGPSFLPEDTNANLRNRKPEGDAVAGRRGFNDVAYPHLYKKENGEENFARRALGAVSLSLLYMEYPPTTVL